MKRIFICMLIALAVPAWSMKDRGSFIENSLLAEGYVLKTWAEGDLNKDGIQDLVFVADEPESGNRILWVYIFKENAENVLLLSNVHALYRADEGGVWGDPLESISIARGSLFLKLYGGSNWRWSESYQFQYRTDALYLIGHDNNSFFTGSDEGTSHSYDLLSGKKQTIVTDAEGKKTETWIKRNKKSLINLIDFDINKKEYYLK